MSWLSENWKDLVGTVAPGLATVLAGPQAGFAVRALGDKLLGKPDATEAEVAEYINRNQNPELLVKLKEIEAEERMKAKEIGYELEKLGYQERVSARGSLKVVAWPQISLSIVFILGYFAVVFVLFRGELVQDIPDWQNSVLTTVIGVLTAAVIKIMDFWFGSSIGSKEKTQKLRAG